MSNESNDWVKHLEQAFKPYPDFVSSVHEILLKLNPENPYPEPSLSKVPAQMRRVLLLDAAEVNRVVLSHLLKNLPVELIFASTLEEAKEISHAQAFDLCILNLNQIGSSLPEFAQVKKVIGLAGGEVSPELLSKVESIGVESVLFRSAPKEKILQTLNAILWE